MANPSLLQAKEDGSANERPEEGSGQSELHRATLSWRRRGKKKSDNLFPTFITT